MTSRRYQEPTLPPPKPPPPLKPEPPEEPLDACDAWYADDEVLIAEENELEKDDMVVDT